MLHATALVLFVIFGAALSRNLNDDQLKVDQEKGLIEPLIFVRPKGGYPQLVPRAIYFASLTTTNKNEFNTSESENNSTEASTSEPVAELPDTTPEIKASNRTDQRSLESRSNINVLLVPNNVLKTLAKQNSIPQILTNQEPIRTLQLTAESQTNSPLEISTESTETTQPTVETTETSSSTTKKWCKKCRAPPRNI